MYLYTNKTGTEVFKVKYFNGKAEEALKYRKVLEKKLNRPVVAWCIMGGDNAEFEITNLTAI
jgi:hypothetical protein